MKKAVNLYEVNFTVLLRRLNILVASDVLAGTIEFGHDDFLSQLTVGTLKSIHSLRPPLATRTVLIGLAGRGLPYSASITEIEQDKAMPTIKL